MRRIICLFLLLTLSSLAGAIKAQSSELLLEWDPARNTVSGTVELTGSANIPDQQWFFAEAAPYDSGAGDTIWTPVTSLQFGSVLNGSLGNWNTRILTDGFYQLRLHVVDGAQNSHFYTLGPILVKNDEGALVNIEPVQIIEGPGADPAHEMIPSPEVDDRLPLPVGGHVLHFRDEAKAAMHSAGMTWVKWQIPFHLEEPLTVARDRINWSHEAGFKVLLSITGEKEALAAGGDAYLDAYASFLGEVAALGVDAIEVWNEMNLDREWPRGQIDPRRYAVMLNKAYIAIKAANPATMVITGALAPTGAEGAFGLDEVWNDDRYYFGMANAGVADYADCIGVHYNEGILPPTAQGGDPRDEYPTRYLPLMLQRAAFPFRNHGIPMCITEMGYLSPEGYGPLPEDFAWAQGTSVEEQAEWLSGALLVASNFSMMPVELAIVWNIDFDSYGADPQAGYAIIRPDGSCPACAAIASLQR